MTPEEVAQACQKFQDYLAANGVEVEGYCLQFNGLVAATMRYDAAVGALLCVVADVRGYKVVPK
jgi:hypothetical protein